MRVWETKDLHIKLPKEFGMGVEFVLDNLPADCHPKKAKGKQKELDRLLPDIMYGPLA